MALTFDDLLEFLENKGVPLSEYTIVGKPEVGYSVSIAIQPSAVPVAPETEESRNTTDASGARRSIDAHHTGSTGAMRITWLYAVATWHNDRLHLMFGK